MLLALLHPEVYETIAKGTRRHFANNKARAVLFEGPPGTGKTTSARSVLFLNTAKLLQQQTFLALQVVVMYCPKAVACLAHRPAEHVSFACVFWEGMLCWAQ